MKSVQVEIKGVSPLLMHAYPLEAIEAIEKKPIETQAEISAYRMDGLKSELYIPGMCFQRALVSAATYSKGKGRGSLQKSAAAGIMISPEKIRLGTKTYEIDSRPVVVPATKGRIMRHRPKLAQWKAALLCQWDENLITEPQLRRIFDDCGTRVGILDFRPEKKGPFGKFMVIGWKVE